MTSIHRLSAGVAATVALILATGCGDSGNDPTPQTRSEISPWEFRVRKISETAGNFTGELSDDDSFGASLAAIGDVDGNGVPDLAVGAPWDENDDFVTHGAVWILMLERDGSVRSQTKIAPGSGGLPLPDGNRVEFGTSLAALGDIDGDGVPDFAAGTDANWERPIWIVFLTANGEAKGFHRIDPADIGDTSRDPGRFGWTMTGVGDLDGDGRSELATIAMLDHVCLLSLSSSGAVASSACAGPEEQIPGDTRVLAAPGDVDGNGIPDLVTGGAFVPIGDDLEMREAVWWGWDWYNRPLPMVNVAFDWPGALAAVGDLDGDGISELATFGEHFRTLESKLVIIYLDRRGTVRKARVYGQFIEYDDVFRGPVSGLGDLDGDGLTEIAIGSPKDGDGGPGRGAVFIVSVSDPSRATTTTSSSTTTMAVTSTTQAECDPEFCGAGEGHAEYELEIHLLTPRPVGSLDVRIGYDASAVYFVGSGGDVECRLEPDHNATAVFNDCDSPAQYCGHGRFAMGMMSIAGVTGPTHLATCKLRAPGAAPSPRDFTASVIGATAPNLRPIQAEVELRVVAVAGDLPAETR